MRYVLLLVLAACQKTSATTDAGATAAPSASVASSAAAADAGRPAPAKLTVRQVVETWNDAHVKHDTHALQSLYGSKVQFYGQTLTNADCAAKKGAAFAKSPDYTQAIKNLDSQPQAAGATKVTFTKTSTEKGKSKDYPAVLVVSSDRLIVFESDAITDANLATITSEAATWCLDADGIPNRKVIAPYKISAADAYMRARRTKYFAALEASHQPDFLDLDRWSCPTKCDQAKRECGYDMRIGNHSATTTSNLVGWVYVDAVTGVLFSEDGTSSEPLPVITGP